LTDFDPSNANSSRLPSRLIQLVPRFPPDLDGLGDCAIALGDALWKHYAVATDFIVWKEARQVPELTVPGGEDYPHRVFRIHKRSPRELAKVLDTFIDEDHQPVLLLHYTSYAYSDQGTSWWLPGVLKQFVRRGGRVIGFFHELYAVGKFPSKTWASSRWQHRIFRELLELCVAAITSNSEYLEQMKRDNVARHPLLQGGVCSNVGELDSPAPFAGRPRRLLVFGKYLTRVALYQQHMTALQKILTHLDIEEIADVGEIGSMRDTLTRYSGPLEGKLRIYGPLPVEEVATLMTQSVAGAVNYRYSLRSKSGVVGAYQAHALPVVLFAPPGEPDAVGPDLDCLSPAQILAEEKDSARLTSLLENAADAGFTFYRKHRSCASIILQILPWLRLE
jgi:hypothetical protein